MRATTQFDRKEKNLAVDTKGLQALLNCGRKSAVDIGENAEARIQIGKRVLWNVNKIQKYLDWISSE